MSTAELVKLPYTKLEHRKVRHERAGKFWKATAKAFAWWPKVQKACELKGILCEFNARLVETAIVFKNIEEKSHEVA